MGKILSWQPACLEVVIAPAFQQGVPKTVLEFGGERCVLRDTKLIYKPFQGLPQELIAPNRA
jgi:hypothetical protein